MAETPVNGWVYEIFASIQGEGIYCGQLQTFIRLAGCNLRCEYCDTVRTREMRPALCRVEATAGSGEFRTIPNPVPLSAVTSICEQLGSKTVTLTGGEPLIQAGFTTALLHTLKNLGFRTYLETNGTLYDRLDRIVQYADVIAMDIKIPSTAGGSGYWDAHAQFLEAASSTNVFVKAVISPYTSEGEIRRCAGILAKVNPLIPLVLQPVSGGSRISGASLMALQRAASEKLTDVRVIPQCHKVLGLL